MVSSKSFPKVIGNCFCRLRRRAHAGLANGAIFLTEDLLLNDWSYASRDKDLVMSRAFKDCLLAICAIHQSLSASVQLGINFVVKRGLRRSTRLSVHLQHFERQRRGDVGAR